MSKPRAESGIGSADPPPSTTKEAAIVAVGAAAAVTQSQAPQRAGGSMPPAAVPLTGSSDQASSGSYALPLLIVIVLGLILGFACVRLWRRRQRRQLEALWRQQDATWEAALRRAELVGRSSDNRLPVAH